MGTRPTLVLGATGSTGRRVAERLADTDRMYLMAPDGRPVDRVDAGDIATPTS
jgi:uncharacterized protein YbjT (DUF2867 family)